MRTRGFCCRFSRKPWHLSVAVIAVLCAMACSTKRRPNSLTGFAQRGQQTLVEVIDRDGQSWKVSSVESGGVTGYFVLSSNGQIDIIAITFLDRGGARHAVVYADSAEKDKALAVLDNRFLAGLTNPSDNYKKWLEKNAVFTWGGEQTRRIDVKPGGLGSSDLRIEGDSIVGRMKQARCHCYDFAQACISVPTPWQACLNALCDLINCLIATNTGCSQEASAARSACEVAVGAPQ
jgi:hypothetical protein